ncbi:DUF2141 domain-containing protein [Paraglaciecola hydrolytica]|uniref:DUF2141 domain-containing protein n=1 Tax=Paraglaciecola hydrolytica TaxID=1799789 RepID=A0A136A257_9ALTE|nr:DUF2141 domain-containing protein [Paraglaciecola hydrolytica]KXI29312.1 hypothetical protein AX660_14315 [Paraglaciecola hydrolytica]
MSILLFLKLSNLSAAQLTLTIQNSDKTAGILYVALFDFADLQNPQLSWDDMRDISKLQHVMSENDEALELSIGQLDSGLMCIRVFLDLNQNQQLDRSSLGFPLEPVGFANNPSLAFGEPSPAEVCFELGADDNQHNIRLRQKKQQRKRK